MNDGLVAFSLRIVMCEHMQTHKALNVSVPVFPHTFEAGQKRGINFGKIMSSNLRLHIKVGVVNVQECNVSTGAGFRAPGK